MSDNDTTPAVLSERIAELERDLHESSGVIEGLMTADDLAAAREIVAELLITQRDGHRSDHAMAGSCLCRHCRAHRFVAGGRPRALLDGGMPRIDALREIIHRNDAAAIPPLKRVTLGDIQQVESLARGVDPGLCGVCGMAACGCVPDL